MKKHQFFNTGVKPFPGIIPDWEVHQCRHCGYRSGLKRKEIEEMFLEMVECKNPNAPELTFWEKWGYYIFDRRINCLEK